MAPTQKPEELEYLDFIREKSRWLIQKMTP